LKKIDPVENELFREFNNLLEKWRNNEKTDNSELSNIYTKAYKEFSGILLRPQLELIEN
jgi:predicted acetyltransferase